MNGAVAFLIVGLGNPGAEYAHTRHNAGFMVADELAKRYNIAFDNRNRLYTSGQGLIEDKPVFLLKPMTYMNNSGQAVQSVITKHGFQRANMLVLVDDCRIPLGKVRLRANGGTGGHNGLASISDYLGSQEFARLRLGLGTPPAGDPIDFVLGKFHPDEWESVEQMIQAGADCVVDFIKEGVDRAMSNFNGQ